MYRLIINTLTTLLIFTFFQGCISDPVIENEANNETDSKFALILCEGLYGYNNASLSYFSLMTGKVQSDIFSKINGYNLGDVGNSAVLIDSSIYIIVSTSRVLYEISIKNLKVKRLLNFNPKSYPRQMVVNSTHLYITDAYLNCIYKINRNDLMIVDSILVGAQPEGLCILDNALFVVNSGWGDVNANHPDASSVYKIDLNQFKVVSRIKTYPNPVEIIADNKSKKLFVTYYNLPSKKDSSGGIIEYDFNLRYYKHIKGNFLKTKILNEQFLISLIDNNPASGKSNFPGLALIDLDKKVPFLILKNENKKEFWYNFYYDDTTQQIWICNAIDFQSNGKVLIYNTNTNFSKIDLIKTFSTGLNPNQILLWK